MQSVGRGASGAAAVPPCILVHRSHCSAWAWPGRCTNTFVMMWARYRPETSVSQLHVLHVLYMPSAQRASASALPQFPVALVTSTCQKSTVLGSQVLVRFNRILLALHTASCCRSTRGLRRTFVAARQTRTAAARTAMPAIPARWRPLLGRAMNSWSGRWLRPAR